MKPMSPLLPHVAPGGRQFLSASSRASLSAALLGLLLTATAQAAPAVQCESFGKTPEGVEVQRFTLSNGRGLEASVMTLGATLISVRTPDRQGRWDTITLSRPSLAEYLRGHPLLGSVVGRYANRIAGARFVIDGTEYSLERNAGKHHIHGGGRQTGFAWQHWKGEALGQSGVRLSLVSPDGQAGFPGTLRALVEYRLTAQDELVMDYTATTDKPTHVNLTNHAYWNLGGEGGKVRLHRVFLAADHYLATDEALIPTGQLAAVRDTPMDFTTARAIGDRVDQVQRGYYDDCYVLRTAGGQAFLPASSTLSASATTPAAAPGPLVLAARVVEPESGRAMEVRTTQPGVQFYTGNPSGLCLETQHFPDSPNKPQFPSTLLRPGQTYRQTTVHRFYLAP